MQEIWLKCIIVFGLIKSREGNGIICQRKLCKLNREMTHVMMLKMFCDKVQLVLQLCLKPLTEKEFRLAASKRER